MQKIRRDDKVVVLAGKNKGQQGTVTKVIKMAGKVEKVIVAGVNMHTKHVKENPSQEGKPGGIIRSEAPIHVSNVAIVNPNTNKPDKVGIKKLDDESKVRILKSSGEVLDV